MEENDINCMTSMTNQKTYVQPSVTNSPALRKVYASSNWKETLIRMIQINKDVDENKRLAYN